MKKGSALRQQMVKEIETQLRAPYLFVTQYQGLSVGDLAELRQRLRPIESRYLVAKNSLSRIALKTLGREALFPFITGQTGFVAGERDPLAISKTLIGYGKDHEALKVSGALVDGEILTESRIKELAKLPSQEVLIGKTVFLIKSPLTSLVGVLAGTIRKLMFALQEISRKKGTDDTPSS